MSMVFCRGCGKEIHETAVTCPHCGAPQSVKSTTTDTIPDGIKGWSWGAFLFGPIWAIGNKTWIGLLALVPYVGFIMSIILGFKGREWAWKNKQWDSVDHFNRVQKKWSYWGVMIIVVSLVIGILAAVAIPAYQSYQHRAQEVAGTKNSEVMPQSPQTIATPQTSTLVGQDPESALDDPALKEKFKILLGNNLGRFRERLNVSSGITQEGEWLVGEGGMQHLFSVEEAAFAINSETGHIFAIMLTEGKDITWFGTTDATFLPAPLRSWYKNHGGN